VLYYAFSVFLVPMQEELGWSRAAMTGAFSLALLFSGWAGVPVGRWLDRYGPRALMTVGSLAATGLVLAWGAVTNLPAFYLIWAGTGITMAAVLYEPAFVVVASAIGAVAVLLAEEMSGRRSALVTGNSTDCDDTATVV
jgi:MFS family permease